MTSKIVKKIRGRINQKEWLYEVVASKEAGNKMSKRLATMLTELTKRYANSWRYKRYSYNEDMQAYAMMMLCKTWHKFKPELSDNPFAYYTTCIHGAFCQYLNRERRQRVIKEEFEIECATKDISYEMVDDEQHF